MKRPKVLLGLLVTLALAIPVITAAPALAQSASLGGNVENDFTGPGVLIIPDPIGDVGLPTDAPVPPAGTVSGWDMKDLRLWYDATNDIMYIGINAGNDSSTILGDADGDGYPGGTSAWLAGHGGTDLANLDLVESAAVYFDLNQDGTWDVIAGISAATDYYGFSVNVFTGAFCPPLNFGTPLPTHIGNISPNPDFAHPDLEFTITNWSELPDTLTLTDTSAGFKAGACLGSYPIDDGIGEDVLQGSFGPAINIVKRTNGTNNNLGTGPYVAVNSIVSWTYEVTNTGSENLTNVVVTDDKGTPGNTGDDLSASPVDVSPADGFNDGDTDKDYELDLSETWLYWATGSAIVGQHTNTATATGYFGGIPVSATDPDNYLGVRARIEISPLSDSNRIGEEHVLNATVSVDIGGGYTLYTGPITINFSKIGAGNLSTTSVPTSTGCAQTILTSNVTGNSTVTAQCAFTVVGVGSVSFNISTDGTGDNSGPAEKIWEAQAGIDIEKYVSVDGGMTWDPADSAPGPSAVVGKNVSFKVRVCNNGTEPLTSISVGDTDFTFTGVATSLAAGACDESDVLIVAAVADQQYDLATVNATADGVPVTDNDPAYYTGLTPGIDIEKYVSVDSGTTWEPADSPPGPGAVVGKNISFKVRVCNNGTAPLTNISVGDTDFTFTGVATSLAAGACDESDVLIVAAVAGQQYDLAIVNATADGVPVTDNDRAYYLGGNSAIDLIKYVSVNNQTSWDDANSGPGPSIVTSKGVYFKFRIENTGNVTLTGITLTDSVYNLVGITPAWPTSLAAGAVYEGVIGPIAATAGNHTNTGNATGYWGGNPVSDIDPANYFGFVNCIHIEKSINGDDANSPTGPYIPVGGAVTWVYNITNCGSLNLTNIVVTDDNGTPLNLTDDWHPAYISGDTGQAGVLEPYSQTHEAWIYQASGNATAAYYANVGYVTATTQLGDAANPDDDPAHYHTQLPVGWETYPVSKLRVLLPWIGLLAAIIAGASLLVLRRRRLS